MKDSHFSHSECQMVLETEAESLLCQAQERHMVHKSCLEKKNSNSINNDKEISDINGTKQMFLLEPLKILGGTISGFPRKSAIQDFQSLHSKESNVVIQKTSQRKLECKADTEAGAETTKTMVAEENIAMEEKYGNRKRRKKAQCKTQKTEICI